MFGTGGTHMDPTIAGMLNSTSALLGKGHKGMAETMNEQFRCHLVLLGRGGQGSGADSMKQAAVVPEREDVALRQWADAGNAAFDFSGKSPGAGGGGTSWGIRPEGFQDPMDPGRHNHARHDRSSRRS